MRAPLILVDASQIVTPLSTLKPQRGKLMKSLRVWKNASLLIDRVSGNIVKIGAWKSVKAPKADILESKGHVVLPGFVDSHTHPIYVGSRVREFQWRQEGKNYLEILKQGGGILSTVRATRSASNRVLSAKTAQIFSSMMIHGTTTIEAKSGYGLSLKEEVRHLRMLQQLKRKLPLEIYATFLGAHAFPKEYLKRQQDYVELVCSKMLPQVARERLADFCDVFCETGVFSVAQSRKILTKAKELGLQLRLHADEFKSIGGTKLGCALQASSVDHLMGISEGDIQQLSDSNTVATLLPCTSFFLGENAYAPARKLIDVGAVVALATDFNAGSNLCYSMQMALSLGVLKMHLSPEEAIVAGTLHGAYALGVSDRVGSIYPGKQADLILLQGEDYRELFYRFGTNQVDKTIKKGEVISK